VRAKRTTGLSVSKKTASAKKAAPSATRTTASAKTPAKKVAAKKIPSKKAPAKSVTAKKAPAKKVPAKLRSGGSKKQIHPSAGPSSPWGPFEAMHEFAPGLLWAQNAWLAQIDSLAAPDRKTHELIRMVCSVVSRNPLGIRHHAMLAGEVGATWEEVAGSIVLAEPAFGIAVVVEAFPWARRGWERGTSVGSFDEDNEEDGDEDDGD
jgi:hypothetical protein